MSLTLMVDVVRALTQYYNNLKNNMLACFKLLINVEKDLPTCLVRCDVVIKLVTTSKPLQLVDKRVKYFIIRSITKPAFHSVIKILAFFYYDSDV